MPKRPTADETRDAARILRESDAGARRMVRRIEGAAVGLEASAGEA
jgi:hypothetical protein